MEHPVEKILAQTECGFDVRSTFRKYFNCLPLPPYRDKDLWLDTSSKDRQGMQVIADGVKESGAWDLVRLSESIFARVHNISLSSNYSMSEFILSDRMAGISFVLLGQLCVSVNGRHRLIMPSQTVTVGFNAKGDEVSHYVSSSGKLISVELFFLRQSLSDLLGSNIDSVSSRLKDCINKECDNNDLFHFEMSPSMMNAAIDLANMQYSGKLRYLYTKAKINELVCLLFNELRVNHRQGVNFRTDDVERLQKAQMILIENIAKPVNIDSLSKSVGVNRTKLETGFKMLYGTTVYDFYHRQRMQRAKELLTDSRHSISQVAEAMGYEHPGNFTSAFKKFYGVLPKSIKRHGLIQG